MPTAPTARQAIMDNIADTLASISADDGYRTTVNTVERVVKNWADVGPQQLPWLGFMSGVERHAYYPGGEIRVTLPIAIVGHVAATTDEERCSEISDLMDDVYGALGVDNTRGDNAVMTTCLDAQCDDGDPDTMDSKGSGGTFVMNWEIVYRRTTARTPQE